jgi:hypothetical protein
MGGKRIKAFQPGDRVQLTRKYLQNTGQYTGDEPRRVWIVQEVIGEHVLTDQPADTSLYTAAELAAEPALYWRRIHAGNLQRTGKRPTFGDGPVIKG